LTPIHFSLVYNVSQDRNDLRGKQFILEGGIPMINATEEQRTKQFEVKNIKYIYRVTKTNVIIINLDKFL